MSSAAQSLTTQATFFDGGAAGVAETDENYSVVFSTTSGNWNVGDVWTVILTDQTTGLQTQVGDGFVTGTMPTYTFTFNNKVYVLAGSTVYMSAINLPTTWNDPNASGNGFVTLTNWYSTPEPIVAAAPYQGKLMFLARRTTQIWSIDASIANWAIVQTLVNIGTLAPNSVQPLGDLDVLCLYDSGIRSLRVRDSSLNAYVADMGSPIDALVTASLQANTSAANAAACAGVEPLNDRYWCYLNGVIYAFSFFPSNKIQAWSTFDCLDSTAATFTVTQFVIYQGQIWAYGKDANGVPAAYQYGGSNNNTYDATVMTITSPFHDSKSPKMQKQMRSLAAAVNGSGGACVASVNLAVSDITVPNNPEWQAVINAASQATFDMGKNGVPGRGTHFAYQFVTAGSGPMVCSLVGIEYESSREL